MMDAGQVTRAPLSFAFWRSNDLVSRGSLPTLSGCFLPVALASGCFCALEAAQAATNYKGKATTHTAR